MPYQIIISKTAEASLNRIPVYQREKLRKKLLTLKSMPWPNSVKKLSGSSGVWRIRSGNYRALFLSPDRNHEIHDTK